MSHRKLLMNSRSSNNDFISHTSPQLGGQEVSPNFRAMFNEIPNKIPSSSSDIKDPTIYSRKVSRLSQFSQINQKQQDYSLQSANDEMRDHQTLLEKTYQHTVRLRTMNWKQLSGFTSKVDRHALAQIFWSKLKRHACIWTQDLSKLGLLRENYIQITTADAFRLFEESFLTIFIQLAKFLSYLTLPLQVTLLVIPTVLQILTICAVAISILALLVKSDYQKKSIIPASMDCLYIIIMVIGHTVALIPEEGLLLLLIAVATQAIWMFYYRLYLFNDVSFIQALAFQLIVSLAIYFNLMACFWLLLQDSLRNSLSEKAYLNSLIFVINNSSLFNPILQQHELDSVEAEQIFAIFVQAASALTYLTILLSLLNRVPRINKLKIFRQYLQDRRVPVPEQREAIRLLLNYENIDERKDFNYIVNLMQKLPISVQKPIDNGIKVSILKKIAFFTNNFSCRTVERIASHAEYVQFKQNQAVIEKGELIENLFILVKGTVGEFDAPRSEKRNLKFLCYQTENLFLIGLSNLFTGSEYENTIIKSKTNTILLKISFQDIMRSIRESQKDLLRYFYLQSKILHAEQYQLLQQPCSVCGSINHLTSKCSNAHFIPDSFYILQRHNYSRVQHRSRASSNKKASQKGLRRDKRIQARQNFTVVKKAGEQFLMDYFKIKLELHDDSQQQAPAHTQQIQFYDETIEDEYEPQPGYSYRDITNPSKLTISNMDKQKSMEIVSAQTLKELQQDDISPNIFEINRHQVNKQTLQTAGFQQQLVEDYLPESGINIPLQYKTITQNSNTFKSSSGNQTYQSQKSQPRQPQKPHITLPPQEPPSRPSRGIQPKLTFSYDPQGALSAGHHIPGNSHTQHTGPYFEAHTPQLRPAYRSQTNFVPLQQTAQSTGAVLPIVSEESSSQLNLPFNTNNLPITSAMSISSVGMAASIDDNVRRVNEHTNTHTGYVRRITNTKQTNTYSSAISPGHVSPGKQSDPRRSGGTGSNSYLSSQRFQYQSDLDNHNHLDLRTSLDIDQAVSFSSSHALYNMENVVHQLMLRIRLKEKPTTVKASKQS